MALLQEQAVAQVLVTPAPEQRCTYLLRYDLCSSPLEIEYGFKSHYCW